MKTVLEIIQLSTEHLEKRGISNARREAEELVGYVLQKPRLNLYLDFEQPLQQVELDKCRELLARRAKREPLQYIVGEVEFFNCTIEVTPDVLIPRPETEQLVDQVAEKISGGRILDLCTGSGCIGISLKKRFPEAEVTLSDLSEKALEVAKRNAKKNEVEVETVQGDLLQPLQGRQFDVVISNPPYIAKGELAALQPEVRDHEPIRALISGDTGLEFYERIARDLPAALAPGGKAWLEIGHTQGPALVDLFSGSPWARAEVTKDWSGNERFFSLEKEG